MKIYLCDLTHDGGSEVVPYAIACIGSYAAKHLGAEVQIFKSVVSLEKAMEQPPDVMGFSNYMWNTTLSVEIARLIKKAHPEILMVGGGPEFPLEMDIREVWLSERPYDFYIEGEGECAFAELVNQFVSAGGDVGKMPGVFGHNRVMSMDETPSPYLNGMLDEFLADPKLTPIMESNRGCPFSCTFCVDGEQSRSKVHKYETQRLIDELTYIAQRYKGKTLFFADANFGMFKEDVVFSEAVREIQAEYGFPQYINTSTGKNNKVRVMEVSANMGGALRIAASVQSLDADVLSKIARKNISHDEMVGMSNTLQSGKANTYSELILGLPGDTKEKHSEGICELVDIGFDQIRMHQLNLLNGSQLGTTAEQEKYGIEYKTRILQRSFGVYSFYGDEHCIAETEEIVVSHNDMTYDDYTWCRGFGLTVALFYNERIFFELSQMMKALGEKYSDFLLYLHQSILDKDAPSEIVEIYDEFFSGAEDEFSNQVSKEGIENGTIGNNLLYNAQGSLVFYNAHLLNDFVYRLARTYLSHLGKEQVDYLLDLQDYCHLKKGYLSRLDEVDTGEFSYDFVGLEEAGFAEIPKLGSSPYKLKFAYEDWQKEFFTSQLELFGTTPQGLGKLVARSPMKHTYRHIEGV
jgi:radical SAM superfamily enzyme YgiQ (UPF0313 family)